MHETLKIRGQIFLSGATLEEVLGISTITRYRWVKANRLPHPLRIGNRLFFSKREVEDHLLNKTTA
jgi:predicted DNA-binding transcriptional regulator AlpA